MQLGRWLWNGPPQVPGLAVGRRSSWEARGSMLNFPILSPRYKTGIIRALLSSERVSVHTHGELSVGRMTRILG